MTTFKRNIIIAITAIIALIAIFLTVIIANISTISDPYSNELIFEKSTFLGQWPLTVVRCDNINDKSVVSMTTLTGERYVLNAGPNIDTKNHKKDKKDKKDISFADAKIPMDDIIAAGLKLCMKT